MSLKKELAKLHADFARVLASRLQGGGDDEPVTAADLNVIRQFLKDNGVTSVPEHDENLQRITDALPFTSSDEHGLAN